MIAIHIWTWFCAKQGFLGILGPETRIFWFFGHFFLRLSKYNTAYTSSHVPLNTKDASLLWQHAKERVSPETKVYYGFGGVQNFDFWAFSVFFVKIKQLRCKIHIFWVFLFLVSGEILSLACSHDSFASFVLRRTWL